MSEKKDYKNTLNLPSTNFPMKARLTQLEPKLLERWQRENLYQKILIHRASAPLWVLHDGPPYANGHIHMGHALNKILKDIIVKSKSMAGYQTPYVPGWDCHGLPIEHQVDKLLGSKKKETSQGDIRRKCRTYAEKFVAIQSAEFQRLGVFGEWDNPYLTMAYEYEAVIARELGRFALSKALFQSSKPVMWCGYCRTALAEAEVEYEKHTSLSIDVAFALKTDPAGLDQRLAGELVFFVIWTTTPWTIPANLGLAYNPEFKYGAYKIADGRILVLAEVLAETALARFGLTAEKLLTLDNRKFQGLVVRHPFYERDSKIISAQYITLDQGTGLVHTAPGHGREDYETALAHGLPIFSPLDDAACFTAEVPEWAGTPVLLANELIIKHLRSRGALLAVRNIDHQYPHCWRCRKPLVFRSTPQWFISLDQTTLRDQALMAIDGVRWVPAWGRERIHGMIENRPDWCISRQRSWGVPITVFLCQDCGGWHYSQAISDHLFQLISAHGADVWFDRPLADLLPSGEKCCHCGGDNFEKETDILDVWFDSGSSFAGMLESRIGMPDQADMYLEGSDQHRGWFHSSLLISVGNRGRAPYREVLTHGYVVDGQGRKMSKSLGNTLAPDDVIKKYGADILRLWVAAENYQDDIRISSQILDMLAKAYFNFRNCARFILGNLDDFNLELNAQPLAKLSSMDRFTLHRLNQLVLRVTEAYEAYEFHLVYHLLNNFVVELSAFYHDVVKDTLYTRSRNDPRRRGVQTVMYQTLSVLVRLMAPILSFTCEEIWAYRPGSREGSSVFLTDLPSFREDWHDPDLAYRWDNLLKIRILVNRELEVARRNKIIGASLDARLGIKATGRSFELLTEYIDQLPELFIVSQVALIKYGVGDNDEITVAVSPSLDPKCPRCWVHSPEVPPDQSGVCGKCRLALAAAE
ncbi:MAG: isoleucine--tRNA ligase [Candidatus Adiutrix intracellularis]|nr:MAG: isoleucine--tRNA ligase [Candidatus Adiutrix intracellularis]